MQRAVQLAVQRAMHCAVVSAQRGSVPGLFVRLLNCRVELPVIQWHHRNIKRPKHFNRGSHAWKKVTFAINYDKGARQSCGMVSRLEPAPRFNSSQHSLNMLSY